MHKGFLLYDLTSHKIFTSREVMFFTNSYPFSTTVEGDLETQLPLMDIVGEDEVTDVDDSESLDGSNSTKLQLTDQPTHYQLLVLMSCHFPEVLGCIIHQHG